MSHKLVIVRGLPASGKTTYARRWVAEAPRRRARVNRDDLRAMLHDGYQDMDVEAEVVRLCRDRLVRGLLLRRISVICDDTNLSDHDVVRLAEAARVAGAEVWQTDLRDVSVELCVERDRDRPEPQRVGEIVIRDLHDRYVAGRADLGSRRL